MQFLEEDIEKGYKCKLLCREGIKQKKGFELIIWQFSIPINNF
jgi:hypothetical protein